MAQDRQLYLLPEPQKETSRNFEGVVDPGLRNFLTDFASILPKQEVFSTSSIVNLPLGNIGARTHHVFVIMEKLRSQKVIPYITEMRGKKARVFYEREAVFALAAILWEITPYFRFRETGGINKVLTRLKGKLGEDPLADIIKSVDPTRQFSVNYYPTVGRKSRESTNNSANNIDASPEASGLLTGDNRLSTHNRIEISQYLSIPDAEQGLNWDKEALESRLFLLSPLPIPVQFDIIPRNIAEILVWIGEMNWKAYRDPQKILEGLTYWGLGDYGKTAISYLRVYPKIRNLKELVNAIQRKTAADLAKSQPLQIANPQIP